MFFGVVNIDCQILKNNIVVLVKVGKIFNVLVIYIFVEIKSFSGYIWLELLVVYFDVKLIECIFMNFWEDDVFVVVVKVIGCKKLVIFVLWIEVCLIFLVLMVLEVGYEVYVVMDIFGGIFVDVYEWFIDWMVQVGVVLVIWQQVLLEYQCDWLCKVIYDVVMDLVCEYSGVYGMGVDYVYIMVYGVLECKV